MCFQKHYTLFKEGFGSSIEFSVSNIKDSCGPCILFSNPESVFRDGKLNTVDFVSKMKVLCSVNIPCSVCSILNHKSRKQLLDTTTNPSQTIPYHTFTGHKAEI